jgi:N,N'-diacetyllegionaminate synthase
MINKNKIFIIAEIGVNHNGNFNNAIKLINHAVDANCNAVKFQTFNPDKLLKKNTELAEYQKMNSKFKNMYDLIKRYTFSYEQFYKIKKYCDKKKIIFMSTPFDNDSAIFLNKIGMKIFKTSSTDNQNFLLLDLIKSFKKKIILSTGMLLNNQLENTLNYLSIKKSMLNILHCISDYPTKIEDSQLGNIKNLMKYGYDVGFSDHTEGHICSCIAVSMGASIIEKHITLDKSMKGPDHSSSLLSSELSQFVYNLNGTSISKNTKKRILTYNEKKLLQTAKKSLYYSSNLQKNHILKKENIIPLRPFNNGICPSKFKLVLGKKLIRDVENGKKLSVNDFV